MRWIAMCALIVLSAAILPGQETSKGAASEQELQKLQLTIKALEAQVSELQARIGSLESQLAKQQLTFPKNPNPFGFKPQPQPKGKVVIPQQQQPQPFIGTPLPNGGFFRQLSPRQN